MVAAGDEDRDAREQGRGEGAEPARRAASKALPRDGVSAVTPSPGKSSWTMEGRRVRASPSARASRPRRRGRPTAIRRPARAPPVSRSSGSTRPVWKSTSVPGALDPSSGEKPTPPRRKFEFHTGRDRLAHVGREAQADRIRRGRHTERVHAVL